MRISRVIKLFWKKDFYDWSIIMKKKSKNSFGERIADLLKLKPDEGRTFTCSLPQGTFIVTVSRVLTDSERRKYGTKLGSRSVHIEGYYKTHGITHQFSFSDRDGDGIIGSNDDGGIFDSAQFFICKGVEGAPDEFYQLLIELVEDYAKIGVRCP